MELLRFPAVSGEALDGTPFVAPRDLAAGRTVALFGFALDHRAELETWVPYLDALVRSRSDVRARLFIPLSMPKFVRGTALAAMKAAVTQPELRASTIPLFVDDVNAFARSLGIVRRDHLAVLLIEPDGSPSWSGAGPFTEASGASLTAALGG